MRRVRAVEAATQYQEAALVVQSSCGTGGARYAIGGAGSSSSEEVGWQVAAVSIPDWYEDGAETGSSHGGGNDLATTQSVAQDAESAAAVAQAEYAAVPGRKGNNKIGLFGL